MTTPVPAGDDLLVKSQAEMDKFNADTNGAYKMQMFAGGQLDQFPAMLGDIRTGAVEGGVIPPAGYSGEVPEFSIIELPFILDSAEANAYADREETYGYRRCRIERVYDDAGFYLRTARVCRYY